MYQGSWLKDMYNGHSSWVDLILNFLTKKRGRMNKLMPYWDETRMCPLNKINRYRVIQCNFSPNLRKQRLLWLWLPWSQFILILRLQERFACTRIVKHGSQYGKKTKPTRKQLNVQNKDTRSFYHTYNLRFLCLNVNWTPRTLSDSEEGDRSPTKKLSI